MQDALHSVAMGLTAVAAGAHPGWRRGSAAHGLGAALIMLTAMVDAVVAHFLSVVVWTAVLLGSAMALSALRSPRRRTVRTDPDDPCSAAHEAIGLVAMAVLLPLMQNHSVATFVEHSGHGAAPGALVAVALVVSGAHVIGSVTACTRETTSRGRVQTLLMAGATACMAAAACS